VPHRIYEDLLDDVPEPRLEKVRTGLDRLTPRELEVLKRAIAGETAGDSAGGLGISVRTVELHRQQVLAKLDVKNLTQAVRMIALAQRGRQLNN
jgi:two-component system response regulator FixJ